MRHAFNLTEYRGETLNAWVAYSIRCGGQDMTKPLLYLFLSYSLTYALSLSLLLTCLPYMDVSLSKAVRT